MANTADKVTFESFESYSDGSGVVAIAMCYGFRFGVCVSSVDSITLNPLFSTEYQSSGRTKGTRASAAKTIKLTMAQKLSELGKDWLDKNRAMYA